MRRNMRRRGCQSSNFPLNPATVLPLVGALPKRRISFEVAAFFVWWSDRGTGSILGCSSIDFASVFRKGNADQGRRTRRGVLAIRLAGQVECGALGEPTDRFQVIDADPDGNKFTDCAIIAHADFVMTDDKHFSPLASAGHKPKPVSVQRDDDICNVLFSRLATMERRR